MPLIDTSDETKQESLRVEYLAENKFNVYRNEEDTKPILSNAYVVE